MLAPKIPTDVSVSATRLRFSKISAKTNQLRYWLTASGTLLPHAGYEMLDFMRPLPTSRKLPHRSCFGRFFEIADVSSFTAIIKRTDLWDRNIMRPILFLLSLACDSAVATSAMPFIEVKPDNAEVLGFDVNIDVTPDKTMFVVDAPPIIDGDCFPQSSGSVLHDKSGVEIMQFQNNLRGLDRRPFLHGSYSTSDDLVLAVWVLYECKEKTVKVRKYLIPISSHNGRDAQPK